METNELTELITKLKDILLKVKWKNVKNIQKSI